MKPSLRTLIGIFILLAGLAVYALLIMQLGAHIAEESVFLQTLFYIATGLLWLWPARALLGWIGHVKGRGNDSP